VRHQILSEIDEDCLGNFTDEYLAALWYVTQINPAPIRDGGAGVIAERVGREVIRRFCLQVGPPLWGHQGRHAPDMALADLRTRAAAEAEPCSTK
jgi:hypothetical protein